MLLNLNELEKILGIKFKNIELLKEAITHRSYLNENHKWNLPHNERLEFLGDAVLELAVSQYLFNKYPQLEEGILTSLRASLVNSNSLYEVASFLKLEEYILLSRGEKKEFTKERIFVKGRSYILADVLEAIIGAIYLDQGMKMVNIFLQKYLLYKVEEIFKNHSYKDAKSLFQEKSQEILSITPNYKTLKDWGLDHDKYFSVGVYLNNELIATGEGKSKQEAEIKSAEKALEIKGW